MVITLINLFWFYFDQIYRKNKRIWKFQMSKELTKLKHKVPNFLIHYIDLKLLRGR